MVLDCLYSTNRNKMPFFSSGGAFLVKVASAELSGKQNLLFWVQHSATPGSQDLIILLYGSLYMLVTASSGTFIQPSMGQWEFAALAGIHLLKCRLSVVCLHVNKLLDYICKQWKKRMNVWGTTDFFLKVDMWKRSNGHGPRNDFFSVICLTESMIQYIVEYNEFYLTWHAEA